MNAKRDQQEWEEYTRHYISRLRNEGLSEEVYFGLIDVPPSVLPILVSAFRENTRPDHRASILHFIWQLRVPEVIPLLADALWDESALVWQQAIDGLLALDLPACQEALERAKSRQFERQDDHRHFIRSISEAVGFLRDGMFDEKRTELIPRSGHATDGNGSDNR